MLENRTILIVEDGDEYLGTLSRFLPGPTYRQAKSARAALTALAENRIDLVYLDMRFDRILREDLVGDFATTLAEQNGDTARAWRFLQNNQGLYILEALREAGYGELPVILAYDFSHEPRRWLNVSKRYPRLAWLADATTPSEVGALMQRQVMQGREGV